ncbi:LysM peptidoglycan-binding domain-containing protein [Novosphingobium sp. YJ-S2-02]|uniref:LysM peptidoglycan-binding domain-containing protein n=1 Tax=Novosphingobium aureum TaxID=2792964 RepID=A0A931HBK1_9SPHN|nr:LysM peptidoglycan-binding domain-containing protein [Novosphingobium aureum]MBH0112454.1 LysM peptidoglycan-binding domain-containing protein [Novosphingobium aureum]
MNRSLSTAALAAVLAVTPGTAALAAPAAQETAHVVGTGETLGGIANRAGVSANAIAKANGLEAPYLVKVGQTLTIPRDQTLPSKVAPAPQAASSYTVAAGDTLNGIANRTGVSSEVLARANGLSAPYVVRVGQKLAIPAKSAAARPAPAAAPAAAPPPGGDARSESENTHTVAAGETLGGIAVRAKVPRLLIAEANGLAPPYTVKVGQKLVIPRTRRHLVEAGDTPFGLSLRYAMPWEQIALANDIDPTAALEPGRTLLIPTVMREAAKPAPEATVDEAKAVASTARQAASARFMWPVEGKLRRGYSTGSNYHDGLDIVAAKGTMVRAAASGTVRFAGFEKEQFGNLVVLDHGGGWFTAYAFLSRVTVKQGAKVAAGERIGLVGDTGQAKGSELHFEVRQGGKPVDPLDELPKAP